MGNDLHIVGIAGLGLIGGSLALSLQAKTDTVVYGYDRDGETLRRALESGAADRAGGDLRDCDAVFVALYPQAAVDYVRGCLERVGAPDGLRAGALVVDLCGIKRPLLEALEPACAEKGVHYIGAHPMAGREVSGFAGARATLFDGASLILTVTERTDRGALVSLEKLMKAAGFGRLVHTDAERHDRMIAYTSQLAHILSSAYIQNPLAEDFSGFTGGSFQDLTRVARLSSDMWGELFLKNRDMLAGQLDILIANLEDYKRALEREDHERLWALMENGTRIKEQLLNRAKSEAEILRE